MKSILLLVLTFCLWRPTASAQTADIYKFFDAAWKPAKEKKAVYLLRISFTQDSCWQYSYYNIFGPLVRVETYQDQQATTRHGLFAWYDQEGALDSSGYYYQGLPDGSWVYWKRDHKSVHYNKGKLLSDKEFEAQAKAGEVVDPNWPDFKRTTPESYFPGGNAGWLAYLNENLRYPDRAIKHLMTGTVLLSFEVAPTGKIKEIQIKQSVELSLDDEALRIIRNCPDWIPSIRFDHKVRSYKVQPVGFRLDPSRR
jgi:periplasmic protein TonB